MPVECVRCLTRFGVQAIDDGKYCISTFVCLNCYSIMQHMEYHASCFGKPTILCVGKVGYLGYDPSAVECSKLCPDRVVCKKLLKDGKL